MFTIVRPDHHNYFSTDLYPHSSTPRDRYLAALVNLKANVLAAEAIQREEVVIRRRLEEIQVQKRRSRVLGPSNNLHHLHGNLRHSEECRLGLVRRETEEEQFRRAVFARQQEIEARHLREMEKRRILVEKQRQEEIQLALISRLRQEEEKRSLHREEKVGLVYEASSKQPVVRLVVHATDAEKPSQKYRHPHEHTMHPANAHSYPHRAVPVISQPDFEYLLGRTTFSEQEKPKQSPKTARKPTVHFALDQHHNVLPSSSQTPKQLTQSVKPSLKITSSSSSSQSQPESALPSVSPSSLKEKLHTRLDRETSVEIHDTIRAILASLGESVRQDQSPTVSTPSDSRTHVRDTSTIHPVLSTSSTSSSLNIGINKDSPTPESSTTITTEPTSTDIAKALESVGNIEAAFIALHSDFIFPSQLEFTPSSSPSSSPASLPVSLPASGLDSESSTSNPLTTKLAYNSRNHAVRYHEQMLSSLLSDLDSVESFGNSEVRLRRKEVVGKVEKALERLEEEVEERWRKWSDQQAKDTTGQVQGREHGKEEIGKEETEKNEVQSEEVALADLVQVEIHDDKTAGIEGTRPNSTESSVVQSDPESQVSIEAPPSDLEEEAVEIPESVVDLGVADATEEDIVTDHETVVVEDDLAVEGVQTIEHLRESSETVYEDAITPTFPSTSTSTPLSTYLPSTLYPSEPSSEPESAITSLSSPSVTSSITAIRPSEPQIESELTTQSEDESENRVEADSVLTSGSDVKLDADSDSDSEDLDTFLMPASTLSPVLKERDLMKQAGDLDNSDSDWSEIEA